MWYNTRFLVFAISMVFQTISIATTQAADVEIPSPPMDQPTVQPSTSTASSGTDQPDRTQPTERKVAPFVSFDGWLNIEFALSPGLVLLAPKNDFFNTSTDMVGPVALPEFRIRIFSDKGVLGLFGSIGYTGLSQLYGSTNSGDVSSGSPSSLSSLDNWPYYALVGITFNWPSSTNDTLKTGLQKLEIGWGYAHIPLQSGTQELNQFVSGNVIIVAFSTAILQLVVGQFQN
jgi:hypothetical protein